jgi:hypothetical protein
LWNGWVLVFCGCGSDIVDLKWWLWLWFVVDVVDSDDISVTETVMFVGVKF